MMKPLLERGFGVVRRACESSQRKTEVQRMFTIQGQLPIVIQVMILQYFVKTTYYQ